MEGQNGRDYPSWWFAALWIGVMVLGLAGMAAVAVNVIVKVVEFVLRIAGKG